MFINYIYIIYFKIIYVYKFISSPPGLLVFTELPIDDRRPLPHSTHDACDTGHSAGRGCLGRDSGNLLVNKKYVFASKKLTSWWKLSNLLSRNDCVCYCVDTVVSLIKMEFY